MDRQNSSRFNRGLSPHDTSENIKYGHSCIPEPPQSGYQFGDTHVFEAIEGDDLRHYRVVKKGPYGEMVTELETDEK